jgi:hypothetical protein
MGGEWFDVDLGISIEWLQQLGLISEVFRSGWLLDV